MNLRPCETRIHTPSCPAYQHKASCSKMASRRRLEDNLIMTQAFPDESADSSRAPSPTDRRYHLQRTHSNLSGERTPLLGSANRSRIRIQSAADLPVGRLSRRQSNPGISIFSLLKFQCKADTHFYREPPIIETPQQGRIPRKTPDSCFHIGTS